MLHRIIIYALAFSLISNAQVTLTSSSYPGSAVPILPPAPPVPPANSRSGEYPDPFNNPETFSTTNTPYFSLKSSPIFNRVVAAQMYRSNFWLLKNNTHPTESSITVGRKLAVLKPTFVHGLIYKNVGDLFTDQEVGDYIAVRKKVLETSPYCKFNIILDGTKFIRQGLVAFTNLINDLKNRTLYYPDFVVDAIHFEHWNQAYYNETALGSFILQFLHQDGYLVGGNTYGGSIPSMTDYVGITTDGFNVDASWASDFPGFVLFTNSDPLDFSSEACAFINSVYFVASANAPFQAFRTGDSRISMIQYLALDASNIGYAFAFPVFFPTCPSQNAYDSSLDVSISNGNVYNWIKSKGLTGLSNLSPYEILKFSHETSVTPFGRNVTTPEKTNNYEVSGYLHSLYLILILPLIFGF